MKVHKVILREQIMHTRYFQFALMNSRGEAFLTLACSLQLTLYKIAFHYKTLATKRQFNN